MKPQLYDRAALEAALSEGLRLRDEVTNAATLSLVGLVFVVCHSSLLSSIPKANPARGKAQVSGALRELLSAD